MRLLFAALLSSLCALPLAAAPLHAQYLPPDDAQLRQGEPTQQQLMQVSEFSVVAGNERLSNEQPIPVTAPLTVRLKGKPLPKGGALAEVLISFDSESKSLKKASYDEASKTLSLNYPLGQYRIIMDLLRNDTVYVQYLAYGNGHVWADLHTASGRAH
ncbi:hypothetical protein [Pseudomonas typographi]|uniref:Uncharacterized protein n=1 Tax=Pseudomonas typographi TaxID=2715964 RepID=A0ABR7YYS0_9PSED|nr:hypothetical protein [Pseudomonas typographi]MBD1550883.1 hypothetical protein [Pseudomonas typographi]MBD1589130.1 hypothetical protein [Pseudomonas typographi]MBD1598348.1 hypothetical protein [Pseudomonas typographi]